MWLDVDTAITVFVNSLQLIDSVDFKTIEEAIAYNAAGMDLNWNFQTTDGIITQINVVPTTGGGVYDWTHVGNGMYKIGIPASGGISINNDAEGFGFFSGFVTDVLPFRGPTYGFRAAALNDALIDGGDILDTNITQYSGTNVGAPDTAGFPKVTIKDGTGTGEIALTGGKVDGVALVDVTTENTDMAGTDGAALASVCTELRLAELDAANIPADIDAIPTTTMRGTDGANTTTPPTVNEVRDGILDDATRFSGGNVDAAISSRGSQSDVTAIKAKTDNHPANLAAEITLIEGLLGVNCVLDDFTYVDGKATVGNIYVYDSAANATTHDKVTGLLKKIESVAVITGGNTTKLTKTEA